MPDTIPDNAMDMIDSRDIIARIAVLSALREPGPVDLGNDEDNDMDQDTLFQELADLEALQDDTEGYAPDWKHGATLIRNSYFTKYAQELADDLGLLARDSAWPYTCIDWERAARELQYDYTQVEFAGVTYWVH